MLLVQLLRLLFRCCEAGQGTLNHLLIRGQRAAEVAEQLKDRDAQPLQLTVGTPLAKLSS